jgi:hypothetical protein
MSKLGDIVSQTTDIMEHRRQALAMAKNAQYGMQTAAAPDPWIKVGTTTIDGTIQQVATALLYGQTAGDDVDNNVGWIDSMMQTSQREPWNIGGQWLRAHGSHVNMSAGTAIIKCDIVRRQSEIDAETPRCSRCGARPPSLQEFACARCGEQTAAGLANDVRPPCSECGPHGNAGQVLLLESWVDCGTCNPSPRREPMADYQPLKMDPLIVTCGPARDVGVTASEAAKSSARGKVRTAAGNLIDALTDPMSIGNDRATFIEYLIAAGDKVKALAAVL